MKKLLLLITSIMFTTSIVFPQSWKYELDDRDGLWYKENSKTPFSGTNFSYWDNGKIRNKIVYKKGLRYKFYMYNENGKKIYEDIIKNNIREETEWYENGKKKNHQFFLLQEEGGSMYTGKWTYWYENGKKKEEITYKDGKLDGLETWWYKNGQKHKELTYKDGEPDGLVTWWYENGQKEEEGIAIGRKVGGYDIRDGLWTFWSPDGKESSELIYKVGNRWNGKWTSRYNDGQKKYEYTYKDGKRISSKRWNEDGSVKE
jgi:hypothetical protein